MANLLNHADKLGAQIHVSVQLRNDDGTFGNQYLNFDHHMTVKDRTLAEIGDMIETVADAVKELENGQAETDELESQPRDIETVSLPDSVNLGQSLGDNTTIGLPDQAERDRAYAAGLPTQGEF